MHAGQLQSWTSPDGRFFAPQTATTSETHPGGHKICRRN